MSWRSIWAAVAAVAMACPHAPAQQAVQTHHARLMVQQGHSESVTSLAFSPDGRYAVSVGGRSAVLWDLASGRELVQFNGHADRTEAVAFSPDGKYVLTGSDDHTARLWDAQSGREIRQFVGHIDDVNAVAFSPDGKSVLTGSCDGSARLWDAATGKELRRLTGKDGVGTFCEDANRYDNVVQAVAFSQDKDPSLAGRYVLTGTDAGAQLWDAASGRLVREFPQGGPLGGPSRGRSVAVSPNGMYIATSASDNSVVQLWDARSGVQVWRKTVGVGPDGALAFSSDSMRLLVGQFDRALTATLLNVADGNPVGQLKAGGQAPVAWSPNGQQILTGSGIDPNGYPALLWDLKRGAIAQRLDARTSGMRSVAVSQDGKDLFTLDNGAQVWDLNSGTQTMRFLQRGFRQESPDGKYTLTSLGADGNPGRVATLRDSAGNVRELDGHSGKIDSVGFSPDSRYAYTTSEDLVQVWEVSSGRLLYRFPTLHRDAPVNRQVPNNGGESVLSPDGKWVLSTLYSHDLEPKGMVAHLADAATGKEVHLLQGHTGEIVSMTFSPDSKYVLTGSYDTTVRLWDVNTGNELQCFTGGTDLTMAVAFAKDPRYVISGSLDGETTIWDRATGKVVLKLASFRDGGWAVIDPQGHYDASDPDNSGGLYWVTDNRRSIDLGQLKQEYYTPGLLARALNGERLPDVTGMDTVALPPLLSDAVYDPATQKLQVKITNDGGGVGKLLVKVNDRLLETVEVPQTSRTGESDVVTLDLANAPFVDGKNAIGVRAYDAANRIESVEAGTVYSKPEGAVARTFAPSVEAAPVAQKSEGNFYAIVVGTSTYGDPSMHLTFPAKDAESFAYGLRLGAEGLYGKAKVWIRVLSSDYTPGNAATGDGLPTKANIREAFQYVKDHARPEDTLVVFMAGHGVMSAHNRDLYFYPTEDARGFDFESDPTLKDVSAVSSDELFQWLREPVKTMPLKEVVILDTCAAGGAADALSHLAEKREIPPDQRRAIELLKDGTGTFILMGAAADASSYEHSLYGHGLLTYALLEGMRGSSLKDGSRLDVSGWFANAVDEVPSLAREIGGIQKPLVAEPSSTDFPIGLLSAADREKIVLAAPKPQLTGLLCEDADQNDPLGLSGPVREQLRAAGDVTNTDTMQVMYIDSTIDETPGALAPKLLYSMSGNDVSVRIRLVEGGNTVAEQTLHGSRSDTAELAKAIAAAIVQMALGVKP
jgi:WD40 repeat protein